VTECDVRMEAINLNRSPQEKLIDLLDVFHEHYSELLELLQEKQDVLLDRKIDRLAEITETEEVYLEQLKSLENDRKRLFAEILPSDEPQSEVPLDELLQYFPESLHSSLQDIRGDLKSVVRDVQRLNEENMFLLENRLSVYDRIFNMITGRNKDNKTYGRDRQAREANTNQARLVDEAI